MLNDVRFLFIIEFFTLSKVMDCTTSPANKTCAWTFCLLLCLCACWEISPRKYRFISVERLLRQPVILATFSPLSFSFLKGLLFDFCLVDYTIHSVEFDDHSVDIIIEVCVVLSQLLCFFVQSQNGIHDIQSQSRLFVSRYHLSSRFLLPFLISKDVFKAIFLGDHGPLHQEVN